MTIKQLTENHLSDEEVGLLMQGKARKLLTGEKTREEFRLDLVKILAAEPGVISRKTSLRSQGRCSFGRKNAGREGVGIFVFNESEQE